jgi:hypothetical protein
VKYLMMVIGNQADYDAMSGKASEGGGPAWTEKDIQAMFEHMGSINNDLSESGEFIDAQGLADTSKGRKVSVDANGATVVTDGPYSETKEVLAGYWVIDVASLERATELAARVYSCPVPEGAPVYPVELRAIGESPKSEA